MKTATIHLFVRINGITFCFENQNYPTLLHCCGLEDTSGFVIEWNRILYIFWIHRDIYVAGLSPQ